MASSSVVGNGNPKEPEISHLTMVHKPTPEGHAGKANGTMNGVVNDTTKGISNHNEHHSESHSETKVTRSKFIPTLSRILD